MTPLPPAATLPPEPRLPEAPPPLGAVPRQSLRQLPSAQASSRTAFALASALGPWVQAAWQLALVLQPIRQLNTSVQPLALLQAADSLAHPVCAQARHWLVSTPVPVPVPPTEDAPPLAFGLTQTLLKHESPLLQLLFA